MMARNTQIALALAAVTIVVYLPVTRYGFVSFDDYDYVPDNPMVLAGLTADSIRWAFTTGHASNWHPVTWLSHMLDVELFGARPGGHHLINVLLHAVNAAVLFALLYLMTHRRWPSAVVAALFALHPLHIESVAWVAERKDVLSTLFGLLAIGCYVMYVRHFRRRGRGHLRVWWYAATCIMMGVSLMAKPMLVTLPMLLLLLDVWPLRRVGRGHNGRDNCRGQRVAAVERSEPPAVDGPTRPWLMLIAEKLPLLAISAASCIATVIAQRAGGSVATLGQVPVIDRLANTVIAYLRYLGKTCWPADLAVLYPHPNLPGGQPWSLLQITAAACLLLAITAVVVVLRRRPYLLVGWCWFVGTLVPVVGIMQVGNQAIADRYTYLPLIGLFIAIVWAVSDMLAALPKSAWARPAAVAFTSIILMACSAATIAQMQHWQTSESLYRRALQVAPNSPIMHNNLAIELAERDELDQAIHHYQQAITLAPHYARAHNNLANIFADRGRDDDAYQHLITALEYEPDFAEAHNNLANLLGKRSDFEAAIAHYEKALSIDPHYTEARRNLAMGLLAAKQPGRAVVHLRQVIAAQPHDVLILNLTAWTLATQSAPQTSADEAITFARRAVDLTQGGEPIVLDTLAVALAAAGRFDEAAQTARMALNTAEARGDNELAAQIRRRLDLYLQSKPYQSGSLAQSVP